jgi:ribose 5-phosphate isomerase B
MGSRTVITEAAVLETLERGDSVLSVPPGSIVTPLARDTAKARGVVIVFEVKKQQSAASTLPSERVVVVGSDHGGFDLKQELTAFLKELGWEVRDLGTHSTARCDYPDFAFAVARSVSLGQAPFGVMVDGAGPGSAIVCNKVPGIRAACAYNEFAAWNARAHNDANVLTLGSRATGVEVCKRIVQTFLNTPFEGGRHAERIAKIREVEGFFSTDTEGRHKDHR